MTFIDLNRYFVPLKKDQESNLDIGRFWGPRVSGWLSWDDLRLRRRVILLAEAASGKTEEFRHQCDVLRETDKAAFFLRIEDLADQGTEAGLDRESTTLFEQWLGGSSEGWFFLDSVDEARLNRKSFDTALRRFAKDLGMALERTHVYVSCRVTDWKGAEDRTTYSRYLPAWRKPLVAPVEKPDEYRALLDPIFKENKPSRTVQAVATEESLNELLVVQLVPLSTEQYRALAAFAGVTGVDTFVAAIAKHGLETLTERPGDLLDLADYWRSHGKFGTFAEMLEHGIARKLSEQDAYRPDNETISPQEAREGAERLAGALTLGKSFTLRAPGHESDTGLAAGALDPAEILPNWTGSKRNALLRRGIFAPATYGRVRFHHRSTQEYLAASWLDRLLRNNCPRTEIFHLLFTERYGVETVVPSLRAETAWLSLKQPEIRDEVIRREPLVLVAQGDPGSLPISVRHQLLLQYAAKQAAAEISDDRLDARDLWMFADDRLAQAVRRAWQINNRPHFRFDLLRLVREGKIEGAASLARSVALNKTVGDNHRIVAAQAAEACGDKTTLAALAKELVKKPEAVSPTLAASLSMVLYPQHLSTRDLLKVIAESKKPGRYSAEGFTHQLQQLCDKAPDATARATLLGGLADLCLAKPFTDDFHRVAKGFTHIARHLHDLARSETLRLATISPPPTHLIRLLMVVERADREGFTSEGKPQLHELVRNNRDLNRELFWADVAEHRANDTHGPILNYFQVYFSGSASLWSFSETDLPWLYGDLTSRTAIEDKQVALSAILNILGHAGRLDAEEAKIRAAIGTTPALQAALQAALTPPPERPAMLAHRLRREAHDLKVKAQAAVAKESWINFQKTLLKDPSLLSRPSRLTSWKAGIFRLQSLTNWLRARTGSDTARAAAEWRLLEEGFNRAVADAYRDGMKRLWRAVAPVRPVRKPGGVITKQLPSILAFAGLGVEALEDPDWALNLTEKEAAVAARHACRADEGFPDWLDTLTMAWPKAVLPVLKDQIEREWASPADTSTTFLYRYGAPAYSIQHPVQALIIEAFLKVDAKAIGNLHTALRIVRNLNLELAHRTKLIKAAKKRFHSHIKAKREDFALAYLALLLMLDPDDTLPLLRQWLDTPTTKGERRTRAETTLSMLFNRHDALTIGSLASIASTKCLEALLHLAYSHIRPEDDLVHDGTFSPGPRDNAQEARNVILSALLERSGADAYQAMQRLADDPAFASSAHRFHELARGKAERDAEFPAWTAAEVLMFERDCIAPAKTGTDLLRIVLGVLADIQHNLTAGDFNSRTLLERAQDEYEVQPWLAEQMLARAKGRFHIIREGEIALGDKPDIFVASTTSTFQVAVEIKHGGKGWSAPDLEDALRTQLAEDYLKPEYRRHGVLVVTHHRDRRWQRAGEHKRIEFSDLIIWLSGIAATIDHNAAGHITTRCVGLNAWKTQPTRSTSKHSSKASAKHATTTKKKRKRLAKKAPRKRRKPLTRKTKRQ